MSIEAINMAQAQLKIQSSLSSLFDQNPVPDSQVMAFNKMLFGASSPNPTRTPEATGINAIQKLDQTASVSLDLSGNNVASLQDPTTLLKFQSQLSKNNVTYELAGSMAGKISQGIKQLVTGQ